MMGGARPDVIDGGTGIDTISYEGDINPVLVNPANAMAAQWTPNGGGWDQITNVENIIGTNVDDRLYGDGIANAVWAREGNDVLIVRSGDDVLYGEGGNDEITGDEGNDVLDGGMGNDYLGGGLGDDTYVLDSAEDVVTEAADQGRDTVRAGISYVLAANFETLTLTGSAAIDGTGNELANILAGNGNANRLDGRTGADMLAGGAGNDTYVVDNAGDVVTELSGGGTDTVRSGVRYTLGANVERLTLTGTANIAGNGNALDNVISGNSGNNRLDGGLGADGLAGGSGDDAYVIDDSGDLVFENANEGNDSVAAGFSYSLGSQYVENLTLTGTADLTATGNALANTLIGIGGNNVLNGGNGADNLWGGAGNDSYYVDNIADRSFEKTTSSTDAGGHDVVYAGVRVTLDQYIEDLVILGTANLAGTGNALDNALNGNGGNNALLDKDGNDVLDGGTGADTLAGGLGNDTFYIDNALDRVAELNNQGYNTVYSSVSFALGKQFIETLTLTGSNAINANGNAIANWLSGNDAVNILDGGRGNDILQGRRGADVFVFGLLSGADTVIDFSAADGNSLNLHAWAHGVVGGGGIVIAQVGADTVLTLGAGNSVTVQNAALADVTGHIVW